MKVVSRYCDSCGIAIPATDIQDGTALKFEESYYCKDCKSEVEPLIEKNQGKPEGRPGGGAARGAGPAKPGITPKLGAGAARPGAARPGAGAGAPAAAGGGAKAAGPASRLGKGTPGAPRPGGVAAGAGGKRPVSSGDRAGARPGAKPGAGAAAGRRPGRPADAALDEEDGAEARAAPKKKGLPLPVIGAVAGGVLLVGGIVAFLVFGAKKDPGASKKTENPQAVAQQNDARAIDETEKRVAAIAAVDGVPDYPALLREWSVAQRRIRGGGEYAARAQQKLAELKDERDRAAEARATDLLARAEKLTAGGEYKAAVETLLSFPVPLRGTNAWERVRKAIDDADQQGVAYDEAQPLLREAEKLAGERRLRDAIGVLDAYDRRGAGSADPARAKQASEIDELVARYEHLQTVWEQDEALRQIATKSLQAKQDYDKKVKEKRDATLKQLESASWENQIGNDLFNWQRPSPQPPGSWKIVTEGATRMLVGESGGSAVFAGFASIIGTGKPVWRDMIIEFRYKLERGGMIFAFHTMDNGWATLEPAWKADGQWHTVTFRIIHLEDVDGLPIDPSQSATYKESEEWTMVEGGKETELVCADYKDSRQGGVGFALKPSTKVSIADLRVKHIDGK